MVQWTDKPAAIPQTAPDERPSGAAPRPVVRKARKRGLAGALQVLTICSIFGLIAASYFVFKETRIAPSTAASQPAPDTNTGRIVVMDRAAQCRELGFDNQSGKMMHKGAVACHDAPHDGTTAQSLYRHPTNRMDAVRRSFAQ